MPEAVAPGLVFELALKSMDVASAPATWPDLCDFVASALDVPAFCVLCYDLDDDRMPQVHGSQAIRSQAAQDLIAELAEGHHADDHAIYENAARMESAVPFRERDTFGFSSDVPLLDNTLRRRMLEITRGQTRCIMRLNSSGPLADFATTHEQASSQRQPSAMAALSPYLGRLMEKTIEASRVIAALAQNYANLMSLFDRLAFGAAFCSPDGRVLVANRHLTEMSAEGDGIEIASGRLHGRPENEALNAALFAACAPGTRPATLTISLPRRSQRPPFVLYLTPVRERDIYRDAIVLVLVLDPSTDDRLNAGGIATFGVLTDAELAVCELLIRGLTTREIADRRGSALETVRGQIKSSTNKLSCTSRLDLLRLAMSTSAPVRDL